MKAVLVFRIVAILEAISYLALLGYAMPMKYIYANPLPVSYIGRAHGVLFVIFGFSLLFAWGAAKWSFLRSITLFTASLIPFGSFFLDAYLKGEQNKLSQKGSKKTIV